MHRPAPLRYTAATRMPRRTKSLPTPSHFDFEGRDVPFRDGDTVASALLAAGETIFSRSLKYHRPRGPYCLTGGCAQCLMQVDGEPNVPACRTAARPGQRVERQNAFPSATFDVLAAADLVFPTWFNHHEFLAGVPFAEKLVLPIARQLSGLGHLPAGEAAAAPHVPAQHVDLAIVGGGAAGLAAAQVLAAAGVRFCLFERDAVLGGRARIELGEAAEALGPSADVHLGATVVGLYRDADAPCLAVVQHGALRQVFFQRLLLANGSHPTVVPFEDNDLPGIYAGQAVARLLVHHDLAVGDTVAVVGDPQRAERLAKQLSAAGLTPVAVGAEPLAAHGLGYVQAVTVRDGEGSRWVDCTAVAVCAEPSPSFELAAAAGAQTAWDAARRVFVVQVDERGRTAASGVFAAGELVGPGDVEASRASGRRAAQALLEARP